MKLVLVVLTLYTKSHPSASTAHVSLLQKNTVSVTRVVFGENTTTASVLEDSTFYRSLGKKREVVRRYAPAPLHHFHWITFVEARDDDTDIGTVLVQYLFTREVTGALLLPSITGFEVDTIGPSIWVFQYSNARLNTSLYESSYLDKSKEHCCTIQRNECQ